MFGGLMQRITSLFNPAPVSTQATPYLPPKQPKPQAKAPITYDSLMAQMDKIQAKLTPKVQQANANASLIHNYLAGQTQYPTYSHPNVGGGSNPTGPVVVKGTMPQSPAASSLGMDSSRYAQYIPHIQALADQVMQQRTPKVQDSVDLSPYTAFAQNAQARAGGLG